MEKNKLTGFIPVILFLVFWEGVTRSGIVPGGLLPPFSSVLKETFILLKNGVLLKNFSHSFLRVAIGFILGSSAGIIVGVAMGWNKLIYRSLNPIVSIIYPIPALGWLPILMVWVGINELLPIAIIFICSFFPVCYNTSYGVKNVDKKYINAARSLGASGFTILTRVVFPLALGNIFTGLRLEAGMAWRVIIAAEMVAIPTGIGALMMRAESLIRMDIIIVCLMVLSVMTFLFERIFLILERRCSKWKE